jgi:DNA-binding NtrC family response regulator
VFQFPERLAVLVSNFSLPRRFGKTLLVCSRRCAEVESQLANSGCRLTKVRDGNKALGTIRHKSFDTAILLSTGEQMDLVETILNLRDIKPSMPVIVLLDPTSSDLNAATQAIIAGAIPDVPIFTLSEFRSHLISTKNQKERHK